MDRRRGLGSQRDYADPLPAPTRLPIGGEERTEPAPQPGGGSNTPTRRDAAVTTSARRGRHRTPTVPLADRDLPIDLPPELPTDTGAGLGPKTKSDLPVDGVSDTSGKSTKKLAPVEPDSSESSRHSTLNDAPPLAPTTPPHSAPAAAGAAPGTQRLHDPTGFSFSESVTAILVEARRRSASDVHLISDEAPRIRIAGRLQPEGDPISAAALASAIERVLSAPQQATLDERGYVDLGITDAAAGRLRLNICRHRGGLKVCARLVAAHPLSPTELGLPWEVEAIANHHQGLVVCSGPSGAGKTTTMAALVQLFNERQAVHIITVEDPVEIQYPVARSLISQREVGTHTLSFSAALKGALREDPDIIVIGDLRDRETVAMALSAAETGHLVIATMSTPSGAQTIGRLIDMFPPDEQNQIRATLAGALKLVVSQRLIDAAAPNRRVAAFEVITGNVPLWSLIRDQKLHQLPSLLQRGRAYGMVRLEDSLKGLMLSKTITRAAALANADDPKLLGGEDNATPPSKRARGGSR
ncbi:MAG: PilT/PilU family type 4a pilus ATPase [Nannocystaceae bacterium]|nr:PilT/PilU family type 4a pilus ATPase [Nannocystaceae bacterium]